ncbi:hypothetical protein Ancab_031982 [Ancistrocladus abbreviatus]
MGLMWFLNSIKHKATKLSANETPGKSPMFVNIEVIVTPTEALVDTWAGHTFVALKKAKWFVLEVLKELRWMKAISSSSIPNHGIALNVVVCLRECEQEADHTVVTMDNFSLVLGMDFLDKVKPLSFTKDNVMHIPSEIGPSRSPWSRAQWKQGRSRCYSPEKASQKLGSRTLHHCWKMASQVQAMCPRRSKGC